MKKRTNYFVALLLCVFGGLGAVVAQEVNQPTEAETQATEEKAKIAQAEQVADKFMARFAETLDFNILQREMFVQNETLFEAKTSQSDRTHTQGGRGRRAALRNQE